VKVVIGLCYLNDSIYILYRRSKD